MTDRCTILLATGRSHLQDLLALCSDVVRVVVPSTGEYARLCIGKRAFVVCVVPHTRHFWHSGLGGSNSPARVQYKPSGWVDGTCLSVSEICDQTEREHYPSKQAKKSLTMATHVHKLSRFAFKQEIKAQYEHHAD